MAVQSQLLSDSQPTLSLKRTFKYTIGGSTVVVTSLKVTPELSIDNNKRLQLDPWVHESMREEYEASRCDDCTAKHVLEANGRFHLPKAVRMGKERWFDK